MILLLVSSAAVLTGAVLVAHLFPLRGSIERFVAALIIGQTVITASLLLAGLVLRSFAPLTLLLLSLAEFAAVVTVLRLAKPKALGRSVASTLRNAVDGLREAVSVRPALAVCVVVAAFVLWRAILALRLGVLDYDAFSYHLVTVDVWLQEGAIGRIPQRLWSDVYPANGELMTLWLMAFTRNDSLAAITGLVSLPLAVSSTMGISRTFGASRAWALLAGGLFAITPAVIALTTTTFVDIAAAADLAAAWYLGLLALREDASRRRTVLLALSGIALGLTIGTKQTVLVPAVCWGIVLVVGVLARAVAAYVRRPRLARTRHPGEPAPPGSSAARLALDLCALFVPAVVLGSYWYLRNLLVYANPFWPFSVGPFTGVGTFAEYLVGKPLGYGGAPAGELLLRSWIADFGARHYGYAVSMGGYGVQWLPVLVLAVIGAGTLIHGSRRPTFALANGYAALAIVASVAIALAVAPMSWWARLTLFAIVASLAFAVVALSRIPRRLALVAGATLAIAATWSVGVATATSNISIDSSGRPATMLRLAQLVMGDVAAANGLGMWSQCSAFERIPDGARVTLESDELRRVTRAGQVQIVGFGFNLPHLVVGHRLQRRLVARIAPTDDPVELRMRALAVGATHLVLITRGPSVTAARRDAAQFKSLGVACVGTFDIEVTEIFELVDTV